MNRISKWHLSMLELSTASKESKFRLSQQKKLNTVKTSGNKMTYSNISNSLTNKEEFKRKI